MPNCNIFNTGSNLAVYPACRVRWSSPFIASVQAGQDFSTSTGQHNRDLSAIQTILSRTLWGCQNSFLSRLTVDGSSPTVFTTSKLWSGCSNSSGLQSQPQAFVECRISEGSTHLIPTSHNEILSMDVATVTSPVPIKAYSNLTGRETREGFQNAHMWWLCPAFAFAQ